MNLVKFIFCITACTFLSFAGHSAVPSHGSPLMAVINPTVDPVISKKQEQLMFMKWFVTLSPKAYGKMRGKKLNLFEKLAFNMTRYRMKQQLKANHFGESEGANWGGLALGFFLGLIGVLGAYLFSRDGNFIKWTWIGCGAAIVLGLLFFVIF